MANHSPKSYLKSSVDNRPAWYVLTNLLATAEAAVNCDSYLVPLSPLLEILQCTEVSITGVLAQCAA